MIPLNLPTFDLKLQGNKSHPQIFDILRKKYVSLTPEEWVRQHFVHYLIEHLGYPVSLMANEISLQVGHKKLRADTVLYDISLNPIMIIEYKAPHIPITPKVLEQISAYNRLLNAKYLIISNGITHYCYNINSDNKQFTYIEDIPRYKDL